MTFNLPHYEREDGEYYLKVYKLEIGGEYKINVSGNIKESQSDYVVYSVRAGESISVSEYEYGGYEYSHADFTRTDDNSYINLELFQSGSNWWEYIMPECDVTITPHFSFRGYYLTYCWETEGGYASISWNSTDDYTIVYEESDWTEYCVDFDAVITFNASPKTGYSFDCWEIFEIDCYGNYQEVNCYSTSISYNMPYADVGFYPVFY